MNIPSPPVASTPPLLAGMIDADRCTVVALASIREVAARTVLCRQAETAEQLFLIRTGRVRFARTTADGRDVLLRRLGPGECFGLASLIEGPVHYMGTAVTMEATTVYAWGADAIRQAAATHPQLSQNALRIAFSYVAEFSERHIALLSRTAEQRLGRTIARLGATSGRVLPNGVEVDITNHDLAAMADVGMFTVSRQLKAWEREGHLLKRRLRVVIRHPEALLTD
jgi:CRP-like cAMP-binding protein